MHIGWFKKNWIYSLLILSLISAILALTTSNFIYKSGSAAFGIVILLILNIKSAKQPKDNWLIIGAFLFSIAGDWFLSNKVGDTSMFVKGIAMFFIAHLFYLFFALFNGQIKWRFTIVLLTGFLTFFFLALYHTFNDNVLLVAALIYLVVSCLSFGASIGINGSSVFKWAYVFGVFLVLFSDTIISFTEFIGYNRLDFLILPTYYLAHISITFALIHRMQFEENSI